MTQNRWTETYIKNLPAKDKDYSQSEDGLRLRVYKSGKKEGEPKIGTSLYHNEGFLHAHADGHGEDPILHYMLPLTFKGSGFMEGGLVVWDKEDNKITGKGKALV